MTKKEERYIQAVNYCIDSGCIKFNTHTQECRSFSELFHMWNKPETECWGKESNPTNWSKTLHQMIKYNEKHGNEKNAIITKYRKELRALQYRGLAEVYHEEVHKDIPPGGGEKADRTNKVFGKEQMKDNRFPYRKNRKYDFSEWSE